MWIGRRISSKKCFKCYWEGLKMKVCMCRRLLNSVCWVFAKWKILEISVKNYLLKIFNSLKNSVKNNFNLETCNKLKLTKEKKSSPCHYLSKCSIKANTKAQRTFSTQQIPFSTYKSLSLHKKIHKNEPLPTGSKKSKETAQPCKQQKYKSKRSNQ